MKNSLKVVLTAASMFTAAPVFANTDDQLDVSTLTCEVANALDVDSVTMIMFFIDGYTGGEVGDPILDAARLSADIEKVLTACIADPTKNLMTAMKEALAG